MARLSFHGGAGTVTGSRFLVEHAGRAVLIDCGLFQGRKELRERNWAAPGFDPAALAAVILTHAHLDHSGWLPRLARAGFRGPVVCTPATAELARILLADSARIQEEDAEYANRAGYSRHRPALPLYTAADAQRALERIETLDFGERRDLATFRLRFTRAGHLLGSAMAHLELGSGAVRRRLSFTGDLGRPAASLVTDPEPPEPCDVLVIESTYGDRRHPEAPVEAQLEGVLARVVASRGVLLVPAFAVGRSQQLLVHLHAIMRRRGELRVPVHLDSPMAVDTTAIYRRYPEERGLEELEFGPGSSAVFGGHVYLHRTREESMRLNRLEGTRVIIASSGMLTGGRVLHHLRRLLPEPRHCVVLGGYQAPGTRGQRLEAGERTLRIHGVDVPVRAGIASISGLSAHADADQLVDWARPLEPPARTFVVHGEPQAADALARRLESELGFRCAAPGLGEGFEL
jgi:metallo-beta-lactamase family protein